MKGNEILEKAQAYWWIVALIFVGALGLFSFDARISAHESLVIRHVEREKEIVGLLRKICRKLPGDQEVCNASEDDHIY